MSTILRPPGSHAVGQALVHPNPSPNHLGAAPSLERHAARNNPGKFSSDLAHNVQDYVGGTYEGGQGSKHSPLARGFMNRGQTRMENPRHPSEHPTTGAGRGGPNPHQEHQRKFAEMSKGDRESAVQAHMKSSAFHPPHSMHPDTVKEHSQNKPKLGKPQAFGAKAMVATSKKPAAGFHGGKQAQVVRPTAKPNMGAKPVRLPTVGSMMGKGGGGAVSLAPHKESPRLMPQATKAAIGLPSFKKGIGAAKAQPARSIVSAPAVNHTLKVTPAPLASAGPTSDAYKAQWAAQQAANAAAHKAQSAAFAAKAKSL